MLCNKKFSYWKRRRWEFGAGTWSGSIQAVDEGFGLLDAGEKASTADFTESFSSQGSQGKEVYGWCTSILFRLCADECSTWFPYLQGITCRDGLQPHPTLPCPRGLLGEQSWLCWSSPCPCCLTLEAVLRSKALMHVVTVVSKGEEVSHVEYLALLGRPCCWWVLWPWMEMFVPITKGWGVLWFCKVQAWAEHAFENIKLYFAINLEINVWN